MKPAIAAKINQPAAATQIQKRRQAVKTSKNSTSINIPPTRAR